MKHVVRIIFSSNENCRLHETKEWDCVLLWKNHDKREGNRLYGSYGILVPGRRGFQKRIMDEKNIHRHPNTSLILNQREES